MNKIYSPLKTPDGKLYTAGFPVGHEGGTTGWQAWIVGRTPPAPQSDGTLAFGAQLPSGYNLSESNMRFLALENDDPSFNWRTIKFPQDLPRLASMTEILSPWDPNLKPYKNRGGKIIIYHGWADPAISAYGTLDYYEEMTKQVGGQKEADAFSRLYFVPGMHHCSGGPGPNYLRHADGAGELGRERHARQRRLSRLTRPTARSIARGRCARIRRWPATRAAAASTRPRAFGANREIENHLESYGVLMKVSGLSGRRTTVVPMKTIV